MKSNISISVVFNGRTVTVNAKQHTYAANEKSNGQVRMGWNYSNKHVLEPKSATDKMLITIDGVDHLVEGSVSSGGNWNYNVSAKQTIDGIDYQVGGNVTAIKSNGACPNGMHTFQFGFNIVPIIRSEKATKGTKSKAKAKAKPEAVLAHSVTPTTNASPASELDRLLAKLLGSQV